jgi:4-diphosphocytidyl-2-C-methyl-D-erythritol kinase
VTDHSVGIAAHAKINLFLRVLAKEDTGFHSVETLFCLLDLKDDLVVTPDPAPGEVALEIIGEDLGPPEENLAFRAAKMVLVATGNRLGVGIRLMKRIPVAAGLGGGSSDAAAALLAVNAVVGNAVPQHELLQFAARLGSDVPFFLTRSTLALGWGRGERLLSLPPLEACPGLLMTPPIAIQTPDAYAWVDELRGSAGRRGSVALTLSSLETWGDLARMAGNDFESAVFGRHPSIREGFEALAGTHPRTCRLSGSGATLFGLYRSEQDRDEARLTLGQQHGTLTPVWTMAAPPPGPHNRPVSGSP